LNLPVSEVEIERLRQSHKDSQVLVYAGGLSEAKGIDVALRALAQAAQRIQNLKLLLIGQVGNSGWQQQIGDLGLASHVEVLQWQSYAAMFQYLLIARLALALYQPHGQALVSRRNARKIFTYMHAGLPIIAPDFGGPGEIVEQEGCGLLVDTTDPSRVANAIIALLSNPADAREMGERGRRAVLSKYNWELEQKKLVAAYAGLDSINGEGYVPPQTKYPSADARPRQRSFS
jgi:glycosyltransferase involved in cell wall biosynthesis